MEHGKKIELKNRRKEGKNQKTDGFVSLTTPILAEKTLDELAAISELLEKVGISLEVNRYENTEAGSGYDFVVMKVNEAKYNSVMTRHAGRKADFAAKYDKYTECTVAELREKLSCMSKTKIADELGCHRMTLYRIIKNMEERKADGTMSIWHFTS